MKTINDILPILSPADKRNEKPDAKKCAALSPNLKQKVNSLLSSHSDLKSFMTMMNPSMQQFSAENVEHALFGTAPTLMTLRRAYRDEAATIWMMPQLDDLNEYCSCKEKLDKGQMKQLAQIISTEFSYLKVSEIMLFLYRFKSGRYGHFYGAIDPLVIITALRNSFMSERAAAIEKHERALERERWEAHCREVARQRAEALAAGRPMYPHNKSEP